MQPIEPNPTGRRRDYLRSYRQEGDCWIYTGSVNNKGYGTILGKAAHRYFYEALVSLIPDGMQLDHLCRVRLCVNPEHLEPVSAAVNVQRATDHRMGGTCGRGHDRSNNVPAGKSRGCLSCWRENKRRQRAR